MKVAIANLEVSAFNHSSVHRAPCSVRIHAAFKRHEPKSLNQSHWTQYILGLCILVQRLSNL